MFPTIWLEQKLIEPPASPPGNVQHLLLPASVQSVATVHRRTVCVPLHELPRDVGHALAVVHAVVTGSVVQFGTVPPVMGIVPQHTGVAAVQPAGDVHAPASAATEASAPPLPLPLLLPLPPPLPLPLPLPPPLPLPLPPPLPLPLPPLPPSGLAEGVLLLHARNPTNSEAESVIASGRKRGFMGRILL
jgi:hypothetical protein